MKDFFISYTKSDVQWATWVAAVLEKQGYSVVIQAWDFRPGEDFVVKMDDAIAQCTKCICILSEDYVSSAFGKAEWTKIFADDPIGNERLLIPVRVSDFMPTGLLKTRIFIDLYEKDEDAATDELINGVKNTVSREKPLFPGSMEKSAKFPGKNSIQLKYWYNYAKDIIYLIIQNQNSLDVWLKKTREEKKLFLYSHFAPKQFLILGAKLYRGSICFRLDGESWRVLATIEMEHNADIENTRIHIFDDDMLCGIDSNAKEFNGHIGM